MPPKSSSPPKILPSLRNPIASVNRGFPVVGSPAKLAPPDTDSLGGAVSNAYIAPRKPDPQISPPYRSYTTVPHHEIEMPKPQHPLPILADQSQYSQYSEEDDEEDEDKHEEGDDEGRKDEGGEGEYGEGEYGEGEGEYGEGEYGGEYGEGEYGDDEEGQDEEEDDDLEVKTRAVSSLAQTRPSWYTSPKSLPATLMPPPTDWYHPPYPNSDVSKSVSGRFSDPYEGPTTEEEEEEEPPSSSESTHGGNWGPVMGYFSPGTPAASRRRPYNLPPSPAEPNGAPAINFIRPSPPGGRAGAPVVRPQTGAPASSESRRLAVYGSPSPTDSGVESIAYNGESLENWEELPPLPPPIKRRATWQPGPVEEGKMGSSEIMEENLQDFNYEQLLGGFNAAVQGLRKVYMFLVPWSVLLLLALFSKPDLSKIPNFPKAVIVVPYCYYNPLCPAWRGSRIRTTFTLTTQTKIFAESALNIVSNDTAGSSRQSITTHHMHNIGKDLLDLSTYLEDEASTPMVEAWTHSKARTFKDLQVSVDRSWRGVSENVQSVERTLRIISQHLRLFMQYLLQQNPYIFPYQTPPIANWRDVKLESTLESQYHEKVLFYIMDCCINLSRSMYSTQQRLMEAEDIMNSLIRQGAKLKLEDVYRESRDLLKHAHVSYVKFKDSTVGPFCRLAGGISWQESDTPDLTDLRSAIDALWGMIEELGEEVR
jgi:hypothetical protein